MAKPIAWRPPVPLSVLLQLNRTLKKSLLSKKFYQQVAEKILSKPGSLDANLYFICYSTLLLSSVLNNKQRIRAFLKSQYGVLRKLLHQSVLTASAEGSDPAKPPPSAAQQEQAEPAAEKSQMAVYLKRVSSYLSDIRIFNRLVDPIKYIPWVLDELTNLGNPQVPRLDRLINVTQALNCLILQLLENIGWLTDHNWVGTNDNAFWCVESYIWCSRVWGAYLLIEILQLLRAAPATRKTKDWRLNLFTQVVQVPLVAHWSLYDGCLTPFWVGLCGTGAAYKGFTNSWKSIDLS